MYSLLHGQESIRINENLDNATILKANEDVGLLKKGKVYSIYRYQLSDPNRLLKRPSISKAKNSISYPTPNICQMEENDIRNTSTTK